MHNVTLVSVVQHRDSNPLYGALTTKIATICQHTVLSQ